MGGDPTAGRSSVPTSREATQKVIALHAPKWKPGGLSERRWRSTNGDTADHSYQTPERKLGSNRAGKLVRWVKRRLSVGFCTHSPCSCTTCSSR